jgi:hypothetical protein
LFTKGFKNKSGDITLGNRLEIKSSEAENALSKINQAYTEFTTFYGSLLEKGVDETEYGKVFSSLSQTLRDIYTTSKSNYDALTLNKSQFEAGRLERDAYERSIMRIDEFLIGADFDIGLKVLPLLRKTEKEMLQKHIIEKVESSSLPPETKAEIKQEGTGILTAMSSIEKKPNADQVKETVANGEKIITLGQKVWQIAKQVAPAAAPFILKLFSPI